MISKSQIRKTHATQTCTFCNGQKRLTYTKCIGVHIKNRITGNCPQCNGEGVKYSIPNGPTGFWRIGFVIGYYKQLESEKASA